MKIIKYKMPGRITEYDAKSETNVEKEILFDVSQKYYEGVEKVVKEKAYNGEFTIVEVEEDAGA